MKAFILSLFLLSSCGTTGTIKVYYLDPAKGLVRKQANETLPFVKAKGYLCVSPKDYEAIASCTSATTKVWYLEPLQGLIRKQTNERRAFLASKGYLCSSPSDFQQALERCP